MARERREQEENFKEMELWEHLAELRTRLIRSISYVGIGMIAAWMLYTPMFRFLKRPMDPIMKQIHAIWVYRHITEAFMVRLQISLVVGLIIALPLITMELWGFVAPGLTRTERKGFYVALPLVIGFFALGLTTGYLILPAAFAYFADFFHDGGVDFQLQQNPIQYIMFVVKMELAFGIVFQLPVVLMALAYVGIVNAAMLKQNWRIAIVACSVVAAVATPSNDAITMTVMAIPLCILYLGSIYLVAFVERLRERRAYRPSYDTT
jgi:sec-independent protein translocase protein TatC